MRNVPFHLKKLKRLFFQTAGFDLVIHLCYRQGFMPRLGFADGEVGVKKRGMSGGSGDHSGSRSIDRIKDFRVCGCYPSRRRILDDIRCFLEGRESVCGDGYLPPKLELYASRGKKIDELILHDRDLPLLLGSDSHANLDYVRLMLEAREGKIPAQREIGLRLREHLEDHERNHSRFPRDGGECVVPCTHPEGLPAQLISHKGANLLRLTSLDYPVPDFVILTSQVYRHDDRARKRDIGKAVDFLEHLTGQEAGSVEDPLIFAVRCAMPDYMPGFMPTYLNVGVTENSFSGLVNSYGADVAYRMFWNNLKNLLDILGVDSSRSTIKYPSARDPRLRSQVHEACERIREIDPVLVEDPLVQTAFFIREAYHFFEDNLDLTLAFSKGEARFPSVILQKMICTVRHRNSQVGVLHSRHPRFGGGRQIESSKNIFGEEIMAGSVGAVNKDFSDGEEIRDAYPAVHHFLPSLLRLEREFQAPVTIEFASDRSRRHSFFALLQLNTSAMTGRASITSVMDMFRTGVIGQDRVPDLIRPYHVKQIESDAIDPKSFSRLKLFCRGASILPRTAVSAQIYFSAEAALRNKKAGRKICFCKRVFEPGDTVVMSEVDAILSLTSAAIHVVTICQSFGLPGLLNMESEGIALTCDKRLINTNGLVIREGDWITLSSRNRCLFLGRAQYRPARLLRFINGEKVQLLPEEEEAFKDMARAYREYNELLANLELDKIASLKEIIRLVILEFRGENRRAGDLVNQWFDRNHTLYVEEVFKSDVGDHLKQHTVFKLLTLERKIAFFKKALQKCRDEKRSGYKAGAFMLGRFIGLMQPVTFWKPFSALEVSILINEWILFEKYMQVLHVVGERKITRAKQKILEDGLDVLKLDNSMVKIFMTLKLSGIDLEAVKKAVPRWCDPQTRKAIERLQQPYSVFYERSKPWSVAELEAICRKEKIPLPDLST